MEKFERIFLGLIIGAVLPILLGLISFMVWFFTGQNPDTPLIYLVSGVLAGLILDLIFLKRWIDNRYAMPLWVVISIYVFYNIVLFGMFMGLPVLNVLLGLPAGFYMGNRVVFNSVPVNQYQAITKHVSLFTGFMMLLICTASAIIGLREEGIGQTIQSMLGVSFEITKPMVWGIVLLGGTLLVLCKVMLTGITMKRTIKASIV